MMLMGVLCWLVLSTKPGPHSRLALGLSAAGVGLSISLLSPLLWTTWRPRFLPWPIESYIDGVHNLGKPQAWLFPIFPWAAFAFLGLGLGFFLLSDWSRSHGSLPIFLAGGTGLALIFGGRWLDARPQIYPVSDFWHTSPNFFLIRLGLLLMILTAVYAWCRWGAGQWGFSPLIQLGQTSLLVYWVHIELVYGRFSILPKKVQDIRGASLGLFTIFLCMLVLSLLRTGLKGRGGEVRAWMLRPLRARAG
jgi:hypothetical protein